MQYSQVVPLTLKFGILLILLFLEDGDEHVEEFLVFKFFIHFAFRLPWLPFEGVFDHITEIFIV